MNFFSSQRRATFSAKQSTRSNATSTPSNASDSQLPLSTSNPHLSTPSHFTTSQVSSPLSSATKTEKSEKSNVTSTTHASSMYPSVLKEGEIHFSPTHFMPLSGMLDDLKTLKFSKLDLSSVHVPNVQLKKVRPLDFDPYLQSIHSVYETYQANRALGLLQVTRGTPHLDSTKRLPKKKNHAATRRSSSSDLAIETKSTSVLTHETSTTSLDSPSESLYSLLGIPRPPPTSSSLRYLEYNSDTTSKAFDLETSPLEGIHLPSLETIPNVFFEKDFSLQNPHFFDLITQQLPLDQLDTLQSPLSEYLDTIELHLIHEISTRSSSFFSALDNLKGLHDETSQSIQQLQALKTVLQDLSSMHSKTALETVYLTQRKQNIQKLHDTVQRIQTIRQAHPLIQSYLHQSDYLSALNLISESLQALNGPTTSTSSLKDLKGVKTLTQFKTQFIETSRTIGSLLEKEFCDLMMTVYQYKELEEGVEIDQRLTPLVMGLIRIDGLQHSIYAFREKVYLEIKNAIKKALPSDFLMETSKKEKDTQPPSSEKSKTLKSLSLDAYLDLLNQLFKTSLDCLSRMHRVHTVLSKCIRDSEHQKIIPGSDKSYVAPPSTPLTSLSVTEDESDVPVPSATTSSSLYSSSTLSSTFSSFREKEPTPSMIVNASTTPLSFGSLMTDSLRVLHGAADVCHTRSSKWILQRMEQNTKLSLNEFHRMITLVYSFLQSTEELLPNYNSTTLKSTLTSQSKGFLSNFHMEKTKQLTILIENESWSNTDVLMDFQAMVNNITLVPAPSSDPSLLPLSSSSSSSSSSNSDSTSQTSIQTLNPSQLFIGSVGYHVVSVVLMLIKMVQEFLQIIDKLPFLSVEITQKLSELLKLFNSKSCQMVLGAGAMQTAGLKSISAKHLVLTTQSLGAILALLPFLRTQLSRYLNDKQQVFLVEFDKVQKDLYEHQQALFRKLVSLMEERYTFHTSQWILQSWESQEESSSTSSTPSCTPTMEQLLKELLALHKLLWKYLPLDQLQSIFTEVFQVGQTRFETALNQLHIFSVPAKTKLLIDVQFYIQKLNALENVHGPGHQLEVTVNSKKIEDPSTVVQHRPSTPKLMEPSTNLSSSMFSTTISSKPFGSTMGSFQSFKQMMQTAKQSIEKQSSSNEVTTESGISTNSNTGSNPSEGMSTSSSSTLTPPSNQPAREAALKTKQLASEWMRKMNFMKNNE